ncbi:Bifunctional (p)ppGpp synthase/hydrolase relA [Nonomuraea coxensis DSM 45129]|uniref:Bifunctional (P)ppGpp synthase/hydrolase relA n=1 Tax=Nonomuraea coxensis DSM 45129 TaxID=1122611 RepID=A0ABX8U6U5_9ACTN|nr:HD domain-containing protein [Nonomuraea coxensis]QYC43477.1 Bifunctional (p)ppGpp synthase/hydrolase relA [Nonomuraea coxensis DSM 45129]
MNRGDPLRPLLRAVGEGPGADGLDGERLRLVRRAYEVAAHWHDGQRRHSGDPYVTHPLAVAVILAEQGVRDHEVLCAALLHDVLDDTACPEAELAEFGGTVLGLLRGLRALGDPRRAPEDRRDSADARVLALKLADRLHNLRTARFLPEAKRRRKAAETLELYVPAAGRAGLERVGEELRRLATAHLPGNGPYRIVRAGAVLLPPHARARYLEEWLAELHAIPTRRERRRFAAGLLLGMPAMAAALGRWDVAGWARELRGRIGTGPGRG